MVVKSVSNNFLVNSYASQMFSRRQSNSQSAVPPPPPPEAENSRRNRWDAREPRDTRDHHGSHDSSKFNQDYRERDRRDDRQYERQDDRQYERRDDRQYERRDERRDDRRYERRDDRNDERRGERRDDRGGRHDGGYHSKDFLDSRRPEYRDRRDSGRDWHQRRRSVSPQERVKAVPLEQRPRNLNNWDAAPPGFEKISADKAKLTGIFPPPGNVAKIANFSISNLDSTKAALLSRMTGGGHVAAHDAAAAMQPIGMTNRAQRRVYVGGIPMMAGEEDLTALFNRLLGRNSGLDPVLAVQIAQDHSYAFIEFRTAEQATQAIEMDGTPFHDVTLRIRRPKEYSQPGEYTSQASAAPMAVMHTLPAPSEPNQLVLTGFPRFLSEEHLRQMALPFGELKFFRLLADPVTENGRSLEDRSYGLAVLEYVDPNDGEGFFATVNQLAMGPSYTLSVQRLEACEGDDETMHILSKFGLAPGSICSDQSRVLLMLNAVGMDDLLDDERYANLQTDLRLSMEAYGRIVKLVLPRPTAGQAIASVGRIFIEYDTEEAVEKAIAAISGKSFADRMVLAIPYPEDRFERRIF